MPRQATYEALGGPLLCRGDPGPRAPSGRALGRARTRSDASRTLGRARTRGRSDALGRARARSDALGRARTRADALGRARTRSDALGRFRTLGRSRARSDALRRSDALGCSDALGRSDAFRCARTRSAARGLKLHCLRLMNSCWGGDRAVIRSGLGALGPQAQRLRPNDQDPEIKIQGQCLGSTSKA